MVILLAPLADSMEAIALALCACYIGTVLLTFLFGRDLGGERVGVIAAVLTALSPHVLTYATQPMTEMPFLCATMGALVLARKSRWTYALGLALVSCTFRFIGVTLVGAVAIGALWEWKRPAAIIAPLLTVFAATLLLGVTGRFNLPLHSGPYGGDPITYWQLPVRIFNNAYAYLTQFGPHAVIPWRGSNLLAWSSAGFAVLVAAAVGLWRRDLVLSVYVPTYCGALLVWPEVLGGVRYLVPIIPLLLVGLASLYRHLLPGALIVAVLVISLHVNRLVAKHGQPHPPNWPAYAALANDVRMTHPPGDSLVIACRKSSFFEVLSGHRAIGYPFAGPDTVMAFLDKEGATHAVVEKIGVNQPQKFLQPAIDRHRDRFRKVLEYGPHTLYEVVR